MARTALALVAVVALVLVAAGSFRACGNQDDGPVRCSGSGRYLDGVCEED